MTLEDAIKHAEQTAAEQHAELSDRSCAVQHLQLTRWLQELKDRRDAEAHRQMGPAAVVDVLRAHDALQAEGFEDALIGYVERYGMTPVALYDRERCIQILMERHEMSREDAEEFFGTEIMGAWVGEGTPAFATLHL